MRMRRIGEVYQIPHSYDFDLESILEDKGYALFCGETSDPTEISRGDSVLVRDLVGHFLNETSSGFPAIACWDKDLSNLLNDLGQELGWGGE